MTCKHYRAIAKVLKDARALEHVARGEPSDVIETINWIAEELATEFQRDNPRFNRGVFLAACAGVRLS